MVNWQKTCLIEPADIAASRDDFEVIGAFNPGAIRLGDSLHLLVRVAEQPIAPDRSETVALPRYRDDGRLCVDMLSREEVKPIDARVVIDCRTGAARLTSVSYLRHFCVDVDRLDDPKAYRDFGPVIVPSADTETMGVEDPRLTKIGSTVWISYVSVSRHGACTSFASTTDFKTFQRHGVQFPSENKDVVLLPERVSGKYVAYHRPVSATPFGKPEMWTATSTDLVCWGDHRPVRFDDRCGNGDGQWNNGRVGGGTVPVRCDRGWLSMFHGNAKSDVAGRVGRYCGALMVGHANDPGRVVAVSSEPVLVPDQAFETDGFVPGVVFPTAWIEIGHRVAIFYGAADERTAVAMTTREALLASVGVWAGGE